MNYTALLKICPRVKYGFKSHARIRHMELRVSGRLISTGRVRTMGGVRTVYYRNTKIEHTTRHRTVFQNRKSQVVM